MANALFPKTKQKMLEEFLTGKTLKVAMVGSGYVFDAAHEFASDIAAQRVGIDQTLTGVTLTNGVFDAANVAFPAVAAGSIVSALVIYVDTGVEGTSEILAFIDEGPGLPSVMNGASVNLNWSNGAYKIFSL